MHLLKMIICLCMVVLMAWSTACISMAESSNTCSNAEYSMQITLDEADAAFPQLLISMEVSILNDSDTEWTEVCFRDHMSSLYQWFRYNHEGEDLASGITRASCGDTELTIRTEGVTMPTEPIDDQSAVFVELPDPLLPGDSITLEMEYSADVIFDTARCAYSNLIFENEGARTYELAQFYPMLAVYENGDWNLGPYFTEGESFYSRCADFEITLFVPEKYEVIASGHETKDETADGMTEWTISAHDMRDVSIIVSNEYACKTGEVCGVTVNSWHALNRPENKNDDHEEQGTIQLQAAMDSVAAFTEAYGPLPYDELDVVESNYMFGGMEAPGLIRISQLYSWFIGEDDSEADQKEYAERCAGTVAHETAHEWFYAAVGNDQYHEAWLDESLAAFSEQVYWRYVGRSEEEVAAVMKPFVENMPESGNATINHVYHERLTEDSHFDYTSAVYQRGAGFIYQLEQSMGKEDFYTFMREYYETYCLGEAHTEDFISTLLPYIEENDEAKKLVDKYLSPTDR